MNITRHNYEEYFLLYVDNELTIAQRKAVEAFVEENPDLRPELQLLQQSVFPADDRIVFGNKESLLKASTHPNPVNETNCEEYFVFYADDELSNEQKDQVEQFVYRHPQYQASFELFQQARLMPDTAIAYPDKYALYRHEEDDKAPVVRMRWWRMAAAAAVLLVAGGMSWFILSREGQSGPSDPQVLAGKDTPRTTAPAPLVNDQVPANNIAGADQKKEAPAVSVPAPDQTQEVAVTTPKQAPKEDRRTTPIVPAPVKNNDQQNLAVNHDKPANNIATPRNNDVPVNVPQERDVAMKGREVNKTTLIDPTQHRSIAGAVKSDDMAALTKMPGNIQAVAMANELGEGEEPDMITDNKKNRMRGFFRKVSRVFDKATNGDADNERSSIRIASFEFALK